MPEEWEQHRDKYKARPDTFEAYVDVWTRIEETQQQFRSWATFARAANAQRATVERQPGRVADAERLMREGGYEIGEPTKRGARQWRTVQAPEPETETELEAELEPEVRPAPTSERVGSTGRIVVFGATGFTGRLVTAALVERGLRPVLAGRREDALTELADQHDDLETAAADASEPDSIRSLLESGDVLVTTVGPFSIHGRAALDAAVDAGAHYVDSTGEPSFIRHVMSTAGPEAEQSGSVLVPAAGYDFVPGHVAAALAYEAAGSSVRELRILYCASGGGLSTGTRASARLISLESTHRLVDGRLSERPMGRDLLSVEVGGRTRRATLMGGTEPLAASHEWPGVESVSVWLDLGPTAWLAKGASFLLPAAAMIPAVDRRLREVGDATGGGPDADERAKSTSTVTAIAYDGSGRELARGWVVGPNPYDITATTMAAIAAELAKNGAPRAGALGPLELFGLRDPHETAARLGLDST
jgi:short subunit dehydrogenase-like uncharacterized protein